MTKKLSIVLGCVVASITILTFTYKVYSSVAKTEDLIAVDEKIELVSSRLEQKITQDRINNLQQRIWMLEDRYGGPGVPLAPPEIKKEYRAIKHELELEKKKG